MNTISKWFYLHITVSYCFHHIDTKITVVFEEWNHKNLLPFAHKIFELGVLCLRSHIYSDCDVIGKGYSQTLIRLKQDIDNDCTFCFFSSLIHLHLCKSIFKFEFEFLRNRKCFNQKVWSIRQCWPTWVFLDKIKLNLCDETRYF